MNKKFILVILILLFVPFTLFSQIKITGKIVNQKDDVLEFIEVLILNKDSIAVKSELTNSEGKFIIIAEKGEYILQIKQLETILHKEKINANQDIHIGEIKIVKKQQELHEVVITSKKKLIERKVDRLVFNVENSISATGGDALDALKITPSIRVQNDKIEMIGKSNIGVMVDEKLIQLSADDLINFLKTIPSDNIKCIEVITAPPAKYDAEGNSGIVNIILKKVKKDSWSGSVRSSYKQGTYPMGSLGGSFSYKKNRVSILADLSRLDKKEIYTNDQTYIYPNQEFWGSTNYSIEKRKSIPLGLNLVYKINDKLNLGFQYNASIVEKRVNSISKTSIYDNISLENINKLYDNRGMLKMDYYNHVLNINAIQKIDTLGKRISLDVDYFSNKSNNENPFFTIIHNYEIPDIKNYYSTNNSALKITNFSTQLDFEMPNKWANINFGCKISFTKNDNELQGDFYEIRNDENKSYLSQDNIFNYKENNQAFYFSIQKKLSEKWEAKVGFRTEFTQINGFSENEKNKTDYYKFFPTAYLSYKINGNNTFYLDYSRRIARPAYWELNPAKWYRNLNMIEKGNPFLQPSFNHTISFKHTYQDLISSTLSYSKKENGFSQLTIHDGNKVLFIRENYYNNEYINWDESIFFSPTKFWTSTFSLSAWYSKTQTNTVYLEPNYTGLGSGFESHNTFTLTKNLTSQIDYYYSSPKRSGEHHISENSSFDVSLKYTLLDKKLNFAILFNNILGSDRVTTSKIIQNVAQSFRQYYDTQFLRLSVSYKFGSTKIKIDKREGSNEEEKNRTK
jgi:hypothetical protein